MSAVARQSIRERLLERSKAAPGEDVTFRIGRWNDPHSDFKRTAIIDIQAGDHKERAAQVYPLWVNNAEELEIFLRGCEKVSNFYILRGSADGIR